MPNLPDNPGATPGMPIWPDLQLLEVFGAANTPEDHKLTSTLDPLA